MNRLIITDGWRDMRISGSYGQFLLRHGSCDASYVATRTVSCRMPYAVDAQSGL